MISKHLTGGLSDSYLEVKYMGDIHPVTSTGYVQDISLFEHRNIRGETIKVYSYNHSGTISKDWKEDKIGTVLYCKIMGVSKDQRETSLNNDNLAGNAQVTVNELSMSKPKSAYFGYTEVGSENKIVARTVSIEKAGGDTGSVIPFPQSGKSPTSAARLPGTGDQVLANCKIDTTTLVRYLSQNVHRCANCGKVVRDLPLRTLYLIEHSDREQDKINPYLNCSRICHESMVEWIAEVDAEYDRILGVTNDTP